MLRCARHVLSAFLICAGDASLALARNPQWPALPFERGDTYYISWIKLVVFWLMFLLWVATADWVNVDTQRNRLPHARYNAIVFFPFMLAALLFWLIPFYWLGLPLVVLAYAVPVAIYVRYRNGRMEEHERVLTADHLRFLMAERLRPLGIEISAERKRPEDMGPPITLVPQGGTPEENNAHLFEAQHSPGYVLVRELVADALERRAEQVALDFAAESMSIRYEIDGVWQNGQAVDRESGDAALYVLKTIASLKPEERRARQGGSFAVEQQKKTYQCQLLSQGTQTGERAMIRFVREGVHFDKLVDLGMREKSIETARRMLSSPQGVIIFSAPRRGGLTALVDAALNSADRFTRNWVALEAAQRPEHAIENVTVHTYDVGAGQTPASIIIAVARKYPDVIVCRDLVDAASVEALCEQTEQNRLVIGAVVARDCAEALLRVLMLKVRPATFAPVLVGAVNGRLIRKLCPDCREAYAPPPQLLEQLRIPPGKIEALYRPPQNPEEVCETCGGIGYQGRTGIYEVLEANDAIREALIKSPKLDVLRREARRAGTRSLQDEGLLLVLKGETSLQELTRVLKE